VFPDNPLPDKPWVWRTEFFGAFDTVDTALLDKGWCAESGIKIEFVIKKGVGHHPHSLDDPTPVIKFIENA